MKNQVLIMAMLLSPTATFAQETTNDEPVQAKVKADVSTTPTEPAVKFSDFKTLAQECANGVHPDTMQALVRVESGFNPYAIGVVGGSIKQPKTFEEAVAAAKALQAAGKNFSMGLGQINVHNLKRFNLTFEGVFEPCTNLNVASRILAECYNRADGEPQHALQRALSCYYSGNFRTGFREDLKGHPPYVDRIKNASLKNTETAQLKQIPKIDPSVAPPTVVANAKAKPKNKEKVVVAQVSKPVASMEGVQLAQTTKSKAAWDAFGDW